MNFAACNDYPRLISKSFQSCTAISISVDSINTVQHFTRWFKFAMLWPNLTLSFWYYQGNAWKVTQVKISFVSFTIVLGHHCQNYNRDVERVFNQSINHCIHNMPRFVSRRWLLYHQMGKWPSYDSICLTYLIESCNTTWIKSLMRRLIPLTIILCVFDEIILHCSFQLCVFLCRN